MKKRDVEVGGIYQVRVGQWLVRVRLTGESRYGGWDAINLRTNRAIRVRSAQRLRKRFDAPKTDATATNVVAPVATEPAVGANGAETRGDATLPNTVDHAEPQTTGQEGEEAMSTKKGKKATKVAAPKTAKVPETKVEKTPAADPAMVTCKRCKRTIRLAKCAGDGRGYEGRCECGQAILKGKRTVYANGDPKYLDLPNATVVAEPKPEEKPVAGGKKPRAPRADGKMSGLDAAAKVLAEAGKPMNCEDMVKLMLEDGLWATQGKTPAATIYAAIIREIAKKGDASRFRKTDKGMFTLAK